MNRVNPVTRERSFFAWATIRDVIFESLAGMTTRMVAVQSNTRADNPSTAGGGGRKGGGVWGAVCGPSALGGLTSEDLSWWDQVEERPVGWGLESRRW